MFIDYCIYHEGKHYPGEYCPHDDEEDELGTIHKPGWTVLDNR